MDELEQDAQFESRESADAGRSSLGHSIASLVLLVLGIMQLSMTFVARSLKEEEERREAAWRNRPPTGMDHVSQEFRETAEAGAELSRSAAEWFQRPFGALLKGAHMQGQPATSVEPAAPPAE